MSDKGEWVPTPTYLYRNYLYQKIIRKIPNNSFFLDIGTGNGEFIKKIIERGFSGEAIDVSKDAVKLAQKRLSNIKNVKVKHADLYKYEPRVKYDIVFCFEVLEHVKDDELAMKKIHGLLEKNGYLVMSVPAHMKEWANIDEIKGHYRRYEKKELIRKLKKAGFEIENFWSYGFPFLLLVRIISGSGKYLLSTTKSEGKDIRSRESGIQQEYNPKWSFFVTSKIILYPFFRMMNLFLGTDLGFGYIVTAKVK
jgi:SAM-dependent methyltransferase